MSVQLDPPELLEADLDTFFTVFEGSSPDDVCHARQLWSSVTLLPPLESRLVSADIRQRLPVCRPKRASAPQLRGPRCSVPCLQPSLTAHEERRRYEAMADQRREILTLLGRQRDQRIRNELISQAVKHKGKPGREQLNNKPSRETETETETEKDLVKQLQ